MAVRPYRFHLRPTLLVTIMVLVLLTALAVALSASLLLVSVTDTLLHRSRQVSLNATEAGLH